jgi:predicted RND superfamily exporter protein
VALGIAVDDTVHVLTHFRTGRLRGMAPRAALTHSLRQVLAPLVYTTFLVAIGFAVVALSGFAPIRNLGIIFVSVLVVCLLADTTLLPALLLLGEKDAERHHGSAASQPRGERLADGMSRPTSC